jgi:hypothetical protein
MRSIRLFWSVAKRLQCPLRNFDVAEARVNLPGAAEVCASSPRALHVARAPPRS